MDAAFFLAEIISPVTQDPSKEGAPRHRFGTLALCERGEDDGKRFVFRPMFGLELPSEE